MVKQIVRDPLFLQQKSEPATEADKQVITDLMDTLKANSDRCVGMAANMIGARKRIIIVSVGPFSFIMINPVITKKTLSFMKLLRIIWLVALATNISTLETKKERCR